MAEDYQKIVDNLFLKRYCLKSQKRNVGWTAEENSGNGGGGACPLPNLSSFFASSPISGTNCNGDTYLSDESATGDCDLNANRPNTKVVSGDDGDGDVWKLVAELKTRLNSTKNKLSDKDMQQWHDHTKRTNPAGSVVAEVRRLLHPDLCTQAWCKFYEILVTFPNLVRARGRFRTLHLCEAPGAFINALSYYLQKKKLWIKEWDWRANTLNPYYEGNPYDSMIGDDRFIFYTSKRWIFGADDTGDIKSPLLLESLQRIGGQFDLVTADGSIDCQEDPNEQERQLLPLHYCETVCALHTLSIGGNFVLKRFTTFEPASIALFYLLCCAFEEVNLFKPATSKSGNSEVYIVCESYKGLPVDYLAHLRSYYGQNLANSSLVSECGLVNAINKEIPVSFLHAMHAAQKFFIDHQLAMVNFNLATFRCWTPELESQCTDAHSLIASRFLSCTGLVSAERNEVAISTIPDNGDKGPRWLKNMPWQKRGGSYEQRRSDQQGIARYVQSLVDELNVFRDRLSVGGGLECRSFIINEYSCPLFSAEWYELEHHLEPVFGRRLSALVSSKLCHGGLLAVYLNVREIYESSNFEVIKEMHSLESLELCQFTKLDGPVSRQLEPPDIAKNQDCVWIDLTTSSMTKLQWLDFLKMLITSDKPPQSVELTRNRFLLLTRFSANILVVLCCCYEHVTLVQRTNPAGMCTIKAENYRPLPATYVQNFSAYLHRVKYGLSKRERMGDRAPPNCAMDLLQFLPMEYLAEPTFYSKLQRFNNTVLLKICQEMLAVVTKSDPTGIIGTN